MQQRRPGQGANPTRRPVTVCPDPHSGLTQGTLGEWRHSRNTDIPRGLAQPGWKAILDALNTIFGAWITLIHYVPNGGQLREAFRNQSAVSQHSSGSACPESARASVRFRMPWVLWLPYFSACTTVPKALNTKSSKENSSHTNAKGWMDFPDGPVVKTWPSIAGGMD